MRKAVMVLCAVLCLGSAAFGQNVSAEDKEKGLKLLDLTRQGVLDATKGLSDAQWKFKPAADRWSVAEVLEHITLAEDFLYENGAQKALKGAASAPDRDFKKMDAAILTMVPDRTTKRQAPDMLVPTGRWSPAETLDRFQKSRARNIEFLKDTSDLRGHVGDSPFGPTDGFEWLLFIGAHSERHTKQILEVKADPNFPKS